jgi:DinB family protein
MDKTWSAGIWRQFGAAIDMLENALRACPDELWRERLYDEHAARPEFAEFWYVAYHALFWLDFYLSDSAEGFAPPAPFTLSELEAGLLPERVYTKAELQTYLEHGRKKCRSRLETLADLLGPQRIRPDWPDMSVAELLLYNMRHIQEHAAQLNLFLGQKVGSAPGWVAKARNEGSGA